MENFPQPENKEQMRITKEVVVEALKINGREDEVSIELLRNWIDQNQSEIRTIADKKEEMKATVAFEIEWAKVYIESGFLDEAWEALNGTDYEDGVRAMALTLREESLVKEIDTLLDEIESKR
jgi:hypothetical protein